MRFEFATATRILVGPGTFAEAGSICQELGSRPLVVTGYEAQRSEPLIQALRRQGQPATRFPTAGEPDVDSVRKGVALARKDRCDFVIGMGGGSALDAGKAISAMLTNEGDVVDYLELVLQARPLSTPAAPFVAIPTTAGTGSEVTRNAVLAVPDQAVKVSLRSPLMLPRVAIVDPELTYELPPAITASTGLDALTQLIEPFVSARANPMTDALCVEGIRRAARSLRAAFSDGRNLAAREDMSVASLFGGLALANAGLGAVHGFAGPIGGMFPAPHGAVCAALLPWVMQTNLAALRAREPAHPSLTRYDHVGRLVSGDETANAEVGIEWVRRLVTDLGIPRLAAYGIERKHVAELVEKSEKASSMKANPIKLTAAELGRILENAL